MTLWCDYTMFTSFLCFPLIERICMKKKGEHPEAKWKPTTRKDGTITLRIFGDLFSSSKYEKYIMTFSSDCCVSHTFRIKGILLCSTILKIYKVIL